MEVRKLLMLLLVLSPTGWQLRAQWHRVDSDIADRVRQPAALIQRASAVLRAEGGQLPAAAEPGGGVVFGRVRRAAARAVRGRGRLRTGE